MNYLNLTIKQLHNLYVEGATNPAEVLEQVIAALKKDENNILEADMFNSARAIAKNIGDVEKDNHLWGIPFLIKDNIATKGVETNASSNILNGYVPIFNAHVVEKLLEKKAIPVAKTTLDELGMGGRGVTGHKGITFNPYGKPNTRLVGGSSSGSASGVASGYIPFTIGSDTGDSIRKPASYAGIVGFKPTWGRISRYGLYAFMPSLDHVGYFTRSVKDAAILLNVMAGADLRDPTSATKPVEDYLTNISDSIKDKKIAVINQITNLITNKSLKVNFDKLIKDLIDSGVSVEYVDVDLNLLNAIFPTYYCLSCAEATSTNACLTGVSFGNRQPGTTYEEIVKNTRSAGFSPLIKTRFILGNYILQKENQDKFYLRAQKARNRIVKVFNELLNKYDAILLPAAPSHAPLIGKNTQENSEIENNHLAVANLGGFPSITLPLALEKGLPLGINLTSKPFSEEILLNIAWQIERITKLENLYVGRK